MIHLFQGRDAGRRIRPAGAPVALGAVLLAAAILTSGCAGSSDAPAGRPGAVPAPPASPGATEVQKSPEFPPGKFTVQLGAYQSQDGAAAVAVLAKTRFAREVYTVLDDRDGLYKVMLGVFDTKDLARSFRDSIVRQYPQEYRDAWVSELSR